MFDKTLFVEHSKKSKFRVLIQFTAISNTELSFLAASLNRFYLSGEITALEIEYIDALNTRESKTAPTKQDGELRKSIV